MSISIAHRNQAKSIVSKMSLEEKLGMIGGIHGFWTVPLEHLGLGSLFMADASQGVNLRDEWMGEELTPALERTTAFPCMIQLASSWNPELAKEYAKSVGEECRAAGVHILLGPGMNIYRHSQSGRNFEYLGEDPFLISSFIHNYVTGLQSTGVMATIKHLVANNTDFFRRKSNSIVDERSLREIYLPAFQVGINAGAGAVMTAYNLLNGEWCSQNRVLINEILRKEMGFDGLVMTDWWAVENAEKTLLSGQDLEMPAVKVLESTKELLESGKVKEADLDRMVISQIASAISMDLYRKDYQQKDLLENFPKHLEIAFRTASEGTVLLKNDDLLPLKPSQKILLCGKFIKEKAFGGGAAVVEGYDYHTLEDSIKEEFVEVQSIENPSKEELEWADVVVLSTGTLDHEGWDRPFELPKEDENFIQNILSSHSKVLVIVNTGGGVRMTDWNDKAKAIIYAWYGGQIGNKALAQIISGKINPSGKLPISIEREFTDSPGANYLPEGEELYSDWNIEGEEAHPVYDVEYTEGIYVGYRWYDHKNIEPLYPFGHGLSYTTFELSDLELNGTEFRVNEQLTLSFTVSNTGSKDGTEIVQSYVSAPGKVISRPVQELKGFTRVSLKVGESKKIRIVIDTNTLQYWNPETQRWTLEAGEHTISLGSSSRNLVLHGKFTVLD
jgi:beta-glucosidase